MTSLKCVYLNSVTRFILITILVSIFSQSFDCKPINSVTVGTSEQGNISQPIDPSKTADKPSRNNGLGNTNQPTENGTTTQNVLINTPDCSHEICLQMAPAITTDKPSRNNDTNGLDRKRQVLDPPNNDNFGDNATDDKPYEKDGPISPENLFSLVEKVNASDYKGIIHVNVRRKSDNRTVMVLPSMEVPAHDENGLAYNSPILESLKQELNGTLPHSEFNNSLENNNRDTSVNSSNSTPTDVILGEDQKNDPTTDLSYQKNQTTTVSSLSISESEKSSGNNNVTINLTTTMEPPTTPEPIPNLKLLPPNEVEKRQENLTIRSETNTAATTTTTSKLMITTSNPIDEISASTLSNQVTAK